MHRLWYDLRNQSLFEASFRGDVLEIDDSLEQMIWRIVTRFAELAEAPPAVSPGRRLRGVRRAVPAGAAAAGGRRGRRSRRRDPAASAEHVLESLILRR